MIANRDAVPSGSPQGSHSRLTALPLQLDDDRRRLLKGREERHSSVSQVGLLQPRFAVRFQNIRSNRSHDHDGIDTDVTQDSQGV